MGRPELTHRRSHHHHDDAAAPEVAPPVPGRSTGVVTPTGVVPTRPSRTITGAYAGGTTSATFASDAGTGLSGTLVADEMELAVIATLAWDNTGSTGYRGDAAPAAGGASRSISLTFSGGGHVRVQLGTTTTLELDRSGGGPAARRASPTADVRAIIERADPATLRTIANNLHTAMLMRPADDGFVAVSLGDRSVRIAPDELPALVALADGRLASCPMPEPAPAPAPPPAPEVAPETRTALSALVAAARDVTELEAAIASIDRLGESSTDVRTVELAIGGASHVVGVADVAWLRVELATRLAAVRAAAGHLVEPGLDPDISPAAAEVFSTPARAEEEDTIRGLEFRATGGFPFDYRINTPIGTIGLEAVAELQVHDEVEGNPDLDPVTVELAGRAGLSGAGSVGGASGARPVDGSAGAGVTMTGGLRGLAEAALHDALDVTGRDRIRVERRDGRWRATVGWDFGSHDLGLGEIGFRLNLLSWRTGETPSLLGAEIPITSHWLDVGEHARVRLRGTISFAPAWERLMQMLANMTARAAATATADAAVAAGTGAAGTVAEGAAAVGATAAVEGTGAAAAEGAAVLTLEESFAAAAVAGATAGMEMLPVVALVGLIAAPIIGLALVGCAIAFEIERGRHGPRRSTTPRVSHEVFDARMTEVGADYNHRVRAFCAAYAATMRGDGAGEGEAASAGRRAASEWIAGLLAEGHAPADIHAAARSASDLEAQVLASARPAFQAHIDGAVHDLVFALYRVGAEDRDHDQRNEWATRYLRACITLADVGPVPEFRYDECRSPDGRMDWETGEPVDHSACPPDASDPDAPNPSTGTDS
jgi:hypothetical protein